MESGRLHVIDRHRPTVDDDIAVSGNAALRTPVAAAPKNSVCIAHGDKGIAKIEIEFK
jgi:hypothetical protein